MQAFVVYNILFPTCCFYDDLILSDSMKMTDYDNVKVVWSHHSSSLQTYVRVETPPIVKGHVGTLWVN